jgi:hypothetical protein
LYGFPGKRLVGYDNEAGKGDHRHFEGEQAAYNFRTVEKLMADFLADVRRLRGEPFEKSGSDGSRTVTLPRNHFLETT